MSSDRVVNVLLMGETGNGKSTLINSFYNYSIYKSFSEALVGPERCLIATSFTVKDENFKDQKISAGVNDGNECLEIGQSATMSTKGYVFPHVDSVRMRLIDSSGFAATQGPEQDAESVRDIIEYISQYDALHAILIVVKGNQARWTAQFEYCIHQVLVNLSKSAINNLVFVFTGCTKLGDSAATIKAGLKEMKTNYSTTPGINLTKSNCYCFENDAFRVLLAAKRGSSQSSYEKTLAETNWKFSSEEFRRLLQYVSSLPPHDVSATLSINDARVFAQDISLIAEDILSNIKEKNKSFLEKKREIDGIDTAIKKIDVNSLTSIRVQDITYRDIDKPNVVCRSEKCAIKYRLSDGSIKRHYENVCCEHCERFGPIYFCSVFEGTVFVTCTKCKCPWSEHYKVYYESSKSTVKSVNKEQLAMLVNAKSDKERKEMALKHVENELSKLEKEKNAILQAIAKLAAFIKNNAILAYNSRVDEYNKTREETQRAMSRDENTANRLDAILTAYLTQSAPVDNVSVRDIQTIKKRLPLLEIYGSQIATVLLVTERSKRKVNREVVL